MGQFTHLDDQGRARMVDVSAKEPTLREAAAQAVVAVAPETLRAILAGRVKKGHVFAVAQTAGFMAAKKTADLIPLCHPLPLTGVEVDFAVDEPTSLIRVTARVHTVAPTGVEMEALTAVSVAALTLYDMCKALQKDIVIREIMLLEKTGGKSGDYRREP
jgi:cyclic pyranopterin phosphate synthase